jgi:signal transduction histidine kinase
VRLTREHDVVRWQIQDTGIGIPKESQRHLFEKFYRADNVASLETDGTGSASTWSGSSSSSSAGRWAASRKKLRRHVLFSRCPRRSPRLEAISSRSRYARQPWTVWR